MKRTGKQIFCAFLAAIMLINLIPARALDNPESESELTAIPFMEETETTRTTDTLSAAPSESAITKEEILSISTENYKSGADLSANLDTAPEITEISEPDLTPTLEAASTPEIIASGNCGDNLIWALDENGVLSVSGSGDMTNYSYSSGAYAPWYAEYREQITSVIIETEVTSIGNSAFYRCTALTSAEIPDGVTSIGDHAFYECPTLTSVTIPASVKSIGYCAFAYCLALTDLDIRDGVTSIGGFAFSGCSALTSVMIPNSVISIDNFAFSECGALASVTIPDSLTKIKNAAFMNCCALISVAIPNSVTSIGGSAFNACSALTSVTIPDSVISIGDFAFCNCSALTDIYYNGTEKQWNQIVIGSNNECLSGAEIHVQTPDTDVVASGSCGANLTWSLDTQGVLTILGTGKMENFQEYQYAVNGRLILKFN